MALLGVTHLAGARPAVHGRVPAALTLGCGGGRSGFGGSVRRGARRTGDRGHRCPPDGSCLAAAGAAGAVTGVPGFTHRPLGIELAHRRLTTLRLRRLPHAAPQGARPQSFPGRWVATVAACVRCRDRRRPCTRWEAWVGSRSPVAVCRVTGRYGVRGLGPRQTGDGGAGEVRTRASPGQPHLPAEPATQLRPSADPGLSDAPTIRKHHGYRSTQERERWSSRPSCYGSLPVRVSTAGGRRRIAASAAGRRRRAGMLGRQ